jgi:hypothetical protein
MNSLGTTKIQHFSEASTVRFKPLWLRAPRFHETNEPSNMMSPCDPLGTVVNIKPFFLGGE